MRTLRSFLRRLIWFSLAPLLALGLAGLVVDLHQAWKQRDADLRQHASVVRQLLDLKLEAHLRGLRQLAAASHLLEPQPGPAFYQEAQAHVASFGGHVVLADQGRMLVNTRLPWGAALPPLPEPRGRSAVKQALDTGRSAVGDLFEGPVSQSPLLALAVPLAALDHPTRALLVTLEAARFEKRLRDIALPDGVQLALLDSTGRRIAGRGELDLDQPLPPPLGQRVSLGLELAPWTVVLQSDGRALRAQWLQDTVLWLAGLAAAAAAAYLVARHAGQQLEDGFASLAPTRETSPGAGSAAATRSSLQAAATTEPERGIVEIVRTRALLQQLDQDRSAQEAAMRVREHQAWELLRVIPTPMLVTREGVVEFANQSACELVGVDRDHLLGQQPADMIHPQDKPAADALRSTLPPQPGAKVSTRLRMCRPDGDVRDIDSTLVRIDLGSESRLLSVARDVTLEKAAKEELEQSRAELRWLLQQLTEAQEQERKRIALDIHDDLQQSLASIKLTAASLVRAEGEHQQPLRRELAQALDEQVSQVVQSTRRIINDLRPTALDDLGLEAALQSLVARFARETGLQTSLDADGFEDEEPALAPALATTLYRVAQEALNNVRKHAQARHLSVELTRAEDGWVALRVCDDGRGLLRDAAAGIPVPGGAQAGQPTPSAAADHAAGSGLGLAGMRERMRAAGGTLLVRPADGGGTEVLARAPVT